MRPNGKRVLVIDDDQDMRIMAAEVLRSMGFGVVTSEGAAEALDLLKRVPRPDAIVVDLRMPDVSGWEFIEALRADERMRDLPVVILSGLVTSPIAKRLQATAFLRKPFQPADLCLAVERAAGLAA